MGKASKWIRNFLIGKKEEKDKKVTLFPADFPATQTVIVPTTPKVKRRWSFGRLVGKETGHKYSKSVDLIDTNTITILQTMAESETRTNQAMSLAVARNDAEDAAAIKIQGIKAEAEAWKNQAKALAVVCNDAEYAAATKIQALFRSYLARKALCALRGLVKLQALVRGHLVRKQTSATLRGMHALMAIQVRARVQRIQMAEEAQLVVKRQSSVHRKFSQDNGFRKVHHKTMDMKFNERKNDYLSRSQIERVEHGLTTYYSGDHSISKKGHQLKEYSFSAQNTPQYYATKSKPNPTRATSTISQPEYVDPMAHVFTFLPNYMAYTESSRAKVRSQSEPKQRPKLSMRKKSRRTASMEGGIVPQDVQLQYSPSNVGTTARSNQEPWFIKLYQSRMSLKDNECDSTSTATTNSNYCRSLVAYEASN
ncbi:hypothetical protein L1049_020813 [Liquidambar formosana]|uniref:DUF4005 domain-containing protein n=1 Tax=Liquidambar formosana TaxID=63359 RepID=A0AAP0S7T1_LIQFO